MLMLSQIPARPNAPLFTPALEAAFKPAFHPSYRGIVAENLGNHKGGFAAFFGYPQFFHFGVRVFLKILETQRKLLEYMKKTGYFFHYIRKSKISEFGA